MVSIRRPARALVGGMKFCAPYGPAWGGGPFWSLGSISLTAAVPTCVSFGAELIVRHICGSSIHGKQISCLHNNSYFISRIARGTDHLLSVATLFIFLVLIVAWAQLSL